MRTRATLIVLASVSSAAVLWAAEPAAPAKPADTAATQTDKPSDTKTDAKPVTPPAAQDKAAETKPADAQDANQGEKSDAKSPADQKASPQRFIPSEQVRADFDVSFPIDI